MAENPKDQSSSKVETPDAQALIAGETAEPPSVLDATVELGEDMAEQSDPEELVNTDTVEGPSGDLLSLPPAPESRVGPVASPAKNSLTPKQRLLIAVKPRLTKAQILSAVLLGLLGFAIVVQMQSSQRDGLAGLRQTELIGLLDEVTRRTDDLEAEERRLNALVSDLQSGQNSQQVARDAAEQNAEVQGILSGRLAATGPGVSIKIIEEPGTFLSGQTLFNILEELRNAGAEAIEVNGVRLVASSYFAESDGVVTVGGSQISSPYVWYAIGDPKTIEPALEIPGGAMPQVRSSGATAEVEQLSEVSVDAIARLTEPQFAKPLETDN